MRPESVAVVLAAAAAWLAMSGGDSPTLRRLSSASTPITATPRPLVAAALVVLLLAGAATELGAKALVFLIGAALAAAVVHLLVRRWRTRRDRADRQRAVVELCDALAAELRAGLPASLAMTRACEGKPEWVPVVTAAQLGGDVAAAARGCAGRPGAEGLRAVAVAWEVAGRSGAALADVLDRVAAGLRSEDEARAEVVAALGPPRATAKMLAVLPLAGIGLGVSMGASPLQFLLTTTIGAACLVIGTLLALTGLLWVEHLAQAAEV